MIGAEITAVLTQARNGAQDVPKVIVGLINLTGKKRVNGAIIKAATPYQHERLTDQQSALNQESSIKVHIVPHHQESAPTETTKEDSTKA